jgi:hypothetical protein
MDFFGIGAYFKKRREAEFEAYIAQKEAEALEKKKAEEAAAEALRQEAIKIAEEKERQIQESDEPFIEVVSGGVSDTGGIKMELNWNKAFVKYLREQCNFQGEDEIIVQRWIGALYAEMYVDGNNEALNLLNEVPVQLDEHEKELNK